MDDSESREPLDPQQPLDPLEPYDPLDPVETDPADEITNPKRVFLERGGWTVIVDLVFNAASKSQWLRIRGAFASERGFRCRISRHSTFDAIGKLFGMQDIEIGDPEYDRLFTIKSNDPETLIELLEERRLLSEIDSQRQISVEIGPSTEPFTVVGHDEAGADMEPGSTEDADAAASDPPSPVDEVVITLGNDVEEEAVVHRMSELVGAFLDRLVMLGLATRHRVHLASCPFCGHSLIDQPRCPECAQPVQPF